MQIVKWMFYRQHVIPITVLLLLLSPNALSKQTAQFSAHPENCCTHACFCIRSEGKRARREWHESGQASLGVSETVIEDGDRKLGSDSTASIIWQCFGFCEENVEQNGYLQNMLQNHSQICFTTCNAIFFDVRISTHTK